MAPPHCPEGLVTSCARFPGSRTLSARRLAPYALRLAHFPRHAASTPTVLDTLTPLATIILQVIGADFRIYLLEKTRVVSHGVGERGYHSLYMLCLAPIEVHSRPNLSTASPCHSHPTLHPLP